MVDAVFFRLDVSVEHGAVAFQSHFMRRTRDFEPLLSIDFVIADNSPHSIGENLGAAAG